MLRSVSRRTAPAILVVASVLAASSHAGDFVPIQIRGSFTATGQMVDPATDNLIIFADITGNASHLGRFTGTATEVLYAPDFDSFTVYVTQVAANGDELFSTYEGTFVDSSDSIGTFQITGGTGRFAGASGSGTFMALDGGAEVIAQGVISTVGPGW
jgi:hypothetical protein